MNNENNNNNNKINFLHKIVVIEKMITKILEFEQEIDRELRNKVAMEIGIRLDEIYDILLREKAEILKELWKMQKINGKK
jgi:glutathionylspermidine synthase